MFEKAALTAAELASMTDTGLVSQNGIRSKPSMPPGAGCVEIDLGIPPYLFVLAAFLRHQVIPLGCRMV
ncbi:hypothetical protein [Mesorhizobium sp.]|uniref:hypothetical protein n=1 Tax=Mesorhizobium sp. TaxID=1871066 RepID=UPI0025C02A16|nr:hypothetical protein [Mesorhizobium sp.]